jgi:hypothetical protein
VPVPAPTSTVSCCCGARCECVGCKLHNALQAGSGASSPDRSWVDVDGDDSQPGPSTAMQWSASASGTATSSGLGASSVRARSTVHARAHEREHEHSGEGCGPDCPTCVDYEGSIELPSLGSLPGYAHVPRQVPPSFLKEYFERSNGAGSRDNVGICVGASTSTSHQRARSSTITYTTHLPTHGSSFPFEWPSTCASTQAGPSTRSASSRYTYDQHRPLGIVDERFPTAPPKLEECCSGRCGCRDTCRCGEKCDGCCLEDVDVESEEGIEERDERGHVEDVIRDEGTRQRMTRSPSVSYTRQREMEVQAREGEPSVQIPQRSCCSGH